MKKSQRFLLSCLVKYIFLLLSYLNELDNSWLCVFGNQNTQAEVGMFHWGPVPSQLFVLQCDPRY